MSRDADSQQRLWLSLGYGGKTAPLHTWRYWKTSNDREWIIAAPNGLAEFVLKDRIVFYKGQEVLAASTQWGATWRALAYFYENVIPTVKPPPMS
jgi:hypothetical protein